MISDFYASPVNLNTKKLAHTDFRCLIAKSESESSSEAWTRAMEKLFWLAHRRSCSRGEDAESRGFLPP